MYYLCNSNSNSSGPTNITAWLDFANNVNEVPVVGDWNGDGIDTVGVYNRSNAIYELVNTNANATTAAYGSPGSWPVIGDWNGDGVDTFAVYNPNTRAWLFSNNPNNAVPSTSASITFGQSGDITDLW